MPKAVTVGHIIFKILLEAFTGCYRIYYPFLFNHFPREADWAPFFHHRENIMSPPVIEPDISHVQDGCLNRCAIIINVFCRYNFFYFSSLFTEEEEPLSTDYQTLEDLIENITKPNTGSTAPKRHPSSSNSSAETPRFTVKPPPANIWESEFIGDQGAGQIRLNRWPFSCRYKPMRPTDTVTHVDVRYCSLPLYNHCLCIYFKPWALLFNSLPVGITLTRDAGQKTTKKSSRNSTSSQTSRTSQPLRDFSPICRSEIAPPIFESSRYDSSTVLCSLHAQSCLAPPRLDSSFWIWLDAENFTENSAAEIGDERSTIFPRSSDSSSRQSEEPFRPCSEPSRKKSFQSANSVELRNNQAFYTPKVSGLLFPNSHVYLDVPCNNKVRDIWDRILNSPKSAW